MTPRLVIDADGLFMVSQDLSVVRGYRRYELNETDWWCNILRVFRCVLTPNANEFRMLVARAAVEVQQRLEGHVATATAAVPGGEIIWPLINIFNVYMAKPRTDHLDTVGSEHLQLLLQELTLPRTRSDGDTSTDTQTRQLRALCVVLQGVTVMLKGRWDAFCTEEGEVVQLAGEGLEGSLRRCGGQVRAAIIATWMISSNIICVGCNREIFWLGVWR
jgi:hypothetical protein